MWFKRDGSPLPDGIAVIQIDQGSGLALDAEGKEIRVYTNQGLTRLNKSRDRRKSRKEKRDIALQSYENDPRHHDFVKRHGGHITQARRQISTSYNGRIAELLTQFNRLGYLTDDEVIELKALLKVEPPAPQASKVEPPVRKMRVVEAQEAKKSWVGRVGETIEVSVTVVQSVGIRNWWFSRQQLTIMRDTTDNVLVSRGKFQAAPGTGLKIKAKVNGHALQDGIPQTLISSVKQLS